MILHSDGIMFATEICNESFAQQDQDAQYVSRSSAEISQCLFDMHMLRVVHRDVKPTNIMFSKAFGKTVFIDFGCSEGVT